jgi:hypothetical protein
VEGTVNIPPVAKERKMCVGITERRKVNRSMCFWSRVLGHYFPVKEVIQCCSLLEIKFSPPTSFTKVIHEEARGGSDKKFVDKT